MPTHFFKPVILVFCIILPAWILYRLLVISWKKRNGQVSPLKNELLPAVFIVYTSILLVVTIVPASMSIFDNHGVAHLNIIPVINTYKQLVDTFTTGDRRGMNFALENIIGNIILFVPLGLLLPLVFPAIRTLQKVAVTSFLCSLSIEIIQFILKEFGTYRPQTLMTPF
ncbi:MAG: VanZ family protein [Ferruginibacter sp.]